MLLHDVPRLPSPTKRRLGKCHPALTEFVGHAGIPNAKGRYHQLSRFPDCLVSVSGLFRRDRIRLNLSGVRFTVLRIGFQRRLTAKCPAALGNRSRPPEVCIRLGGRSYRVGSCVLRRS